MYTLYITPPLPACFVHVCDCREGRGVIIGNTQSVSIPFLFLLFFHQSSLYPIKIFAICFYLLVLFRNSMYTLHLLCLLSSLPSFSLLFSLLPLHPSFLCDSQHTLVQGCLCVNSHKQAYVKNARGCGGTERDILICGAENRYMYKCKCICNYN